MRARPPVLTLLAAATAIAVGTLMSTSAFAAAPVTSAASLTSAAVAPAVAPIVQHPVTRACSAPATVHTMTCFALRRADIKGVSANALNPDATPSGFGPSQLDSAYKLPTTAGSGATVAIVDANNDPNAAADLTTYRSQFGLPACTVASGCFRVVNQSGATSPLPANDSGWAGEESLDVDMVSAICPLCKIILVEANSATDANLYAAEDEAVALGAKFVSNSWGGGETSTQTTDDSHFNHTGVAITVSSGDDATGAEYPATSRYVTAVGGTSLTTSSNSRGWSETAWNDAGSGCSAFDTKPTWQTVTTGCARRAEADVSAVADPNTGVAVYQTFGASGWVVYGGTSVAAPIIAGVYADAGTPAAGTYAASYPYSHPTNLFDVTSGSNGTCGAPMCTAGTGWDGPTGLGTPNGTAAFVNGTSGPAPLALNNPGNQSSAVGSSVSLTLSATGGTAPYTFSATGLPTGLSINASTGVISGSPSAGTFSVVATVHDAASGTATASFTWTVSTTGGCSAAQLLVNPGFETGSASPWTASTGVINPNGAGETSHGGTYYAWLDGYGTTHTDTLSQAITVPATCTSATLSFWLHIDTSETTTTTQFDKLTVQAVVSGGATTTLATYSNLNAATGYSLKTLPLSGVVGHTVTIKFTATEDSSLQTSFVIDDTAANVS